MGNLEYINLRENQIADLKLEDFAYARALKQVNMQGNPIVDEKGDDFKKELLILLHGKVS